MLAAHYSFLSLKKGKRAFSLRLNEPSHDNLGPLGRNNHPWKKRKKKQINAHP